MTRYVTDTKEFWERKWSHDLFWRYSGLEQYLALNRKLLGTIKRHVRPTDHTILEVGCARGKHLIYFSKKIGLQVTGTDVSAEGLRMADRNMLLAGVSGNLYCESIFTPTLPSESFDIVYSTGLIEHFENWQEVLDKQLSLLKKGGLLIATVPNFRESIYYDVTGLTKKRQWLLTSANLDVMRKSAFHDYAQTRGLTIKYLSYIGSLDLILALGMLRMNRATVLLLHAVNQIMGYAWYYLPVPRYFAPHLMFIGVK